MPSQGKNRARKAKAEGRRESKRKIQDCGVTLNQKNCLELLLSVHAQTLETCVLCLEQKAAKCLTYKQGFGLGFWDQNTGWPPWKGDFLQNSLMLLAEKQLSTGLNCTGKQGAIEFKTRLTNKIIGQLFICYIRGWHKEVLIFMQ